MRTITKKRDVQDTYYICDGCAEEFLNDEEAALRCEKKHTCQHHYEFFIDIESLFEDDYWYYIGCRCVKCKLENPDKPRIQFEMNDVPQNTIQSLYDYLIDFYEKRYDEDVKHFNSKD